MSLVQIEDTQPQEAMSVRQMFEQLARDEAAMVREARERALKHIGLNTASIAGGASDDDLLTGRW
ncbi:MAG TPA: hypothetical protein VMU05_14925 [Dongiaceae bacterium]|nr:hypothetical protein [Dongiaceae bacterium]